MSIHNIGAYTVYSISSTWSYLGSGWEAKTSLSPQTWSQSLQRVLDLPQVLLLLRHAWNTSTGSRLEQMPKPQLALQDVEDQNIYSFRVADFQISKEAPRHFTEKTLSCRRSSRSCPSSDLQLLDQSRNVNWSQIKSFGWRGVSGSSGEFCFTASWMCTNKLKREKSPSLILPVFLFLSVCWSLCWAIRFSYSGVLLTFALGNNKEQDIVISLLLITLFWSQ